MTVKPHVQSSKVVKLPTKAVKPEPVNYEAVIKQMRDDIFMVAYRMQFTVRDALTSQKASLWKITTGHLEEMERILQHTMDKYR
jgi:hypothetical protein